MFEHVCLLSSALTIFFLTLHFMTVLIYLHTPVQNSQAHVKARMLSK